MFFLWQNFSNCWWATCSNRDYESTTLRSAQLLQKSLFYCLIVWITIMTSDSTILAHILYQDQSIVQFIGELICPNKNFRGEKCVNITSFEEIKKSTYQCKQCKACSHVLNIPLKDQKPCVTLFGCTYCFRKKTKSNYQKEKLSPLMRQRISQSKLSTTKAEEAAIEPVPKRAKILPYMK